MRARPRKSTTAKPTAPQPTDAELDERAQRWLERLLAEGESASSAASSTPTSTPTGRTQPPNRSTP
jgi:hypothetical protein